VHAATEATSEEIESLFAILDQCGAHRTIALKPGGILSMRPTAVRAWASLHGRLSLNTQPFAGLWSRLGCVADSPRSSWQPRIVRVPRLPRRSAFDLPTRHHQRWSSMRRPPVGPLKPAALRQAPDYPESVFAILMGQGYVIGNPFAVAALPSDPQRPLGSSPALTSRRRITSTPCCRTLSTEPGRRLGGACAGFTRRGFVGPRSRA